jgi:hypothetical protein
MRNQLILFSVLMVILAISGCSSAASVPPTSILPTATTVPAPVISTEDFLGTWSFGGAFIQFSEDGTYRKAWEIESLEDDPFIMGTFQFDDNSSALTIQPQSAPDCLNPGVYAVKITADGVWLHLALIEDACELRAENTKKYSPYKRVQE